ncbi:MAG: nucleotide sugar dehydrogenase [Muribaculum sp.]|nr:nucleotide sugar dehydrogenase [Muribaculum sp.]
MNNKVLNSKIAVLGLGYVGLPLACMFAGRYRVTGLDINATRVNNLNNGNDTNGDLADGTLSAALANGLKFTCSLDDIRDCNVYIVTVPTPVDSFNRPDLSPLISASKEIGTVLSPGDTVIYESTVYPGTTEEECVPILEKESGLTFNRDFYVGYSPERVNPGDYTRPVHKICKIVSGSTPDTAEYVECLYKSVLDAPTHRASSIKVAEAAKILENTQRDVEIALINEAAKIFNALGIDTNDVIEAASTKWNFQKIHPGLVGGHCIGVDPYYLIHKAHAHGVTPRLMTEARSINDSMSRYVAKRAESLLASKGASIDSSRILLLGFTFKENCRDIRNTKVIDIYRELKERGAEVDVYDPYIEPEIVKKVYGIDATDSENEISGKNYNLIIQCVCHTVFNDMELKKYIKNSGAIYDLKGNLNRELVDERL